MEDMFSQGGSESFFAAVEAMEDYRELPQRKLNGCLQITASLIIWAWKPEEFYVTMIHQVNVFSFFPLLFFRLQMTWHLPSILRAGKCVHHV